MFDGLLQWVLALVHQYGYFALFVYLVLETAFLLHYVPSEVVIPVAASTLVHDPLSFVAFVLDATAGATTGSLLAYLVLGRYGREALERYGHRVHLSERSLERSEAAFRRYGESSVFWGRMLPFLRAFISIPAGLAEMDLRRFLVYSAAGALLFNTGLTYLVYTGAGTTSPLDLFVTWASATLATEVAYVERNTAFVVVIVGMAVVLGALLWSGRDWIRRYPSTAKRVALHGVRIVGLLVGGLFVVGALSAPGQAFVAITGVWNDPLFWVSLGFSRQVALLLEGALIAIVGVLAYEIGTLVELANVRAGAERVRERFGR